MKTFSYSVNDESQSTSEHSLTAETVLRNAGFDPANHYLVLFRGQSDQRESFQDRPTAEIHMHEHMRFLAISTEPTPVS
jgi:hypothetical protein